MDREFREVYGSASVDASGRASGRGVAAVSMVNDLAELEPLVAEYNKVCAGVGVCLGWGKG